MTWLDDLFNWNFPKDKPADIEPPPGERNPDCPYCRGLGYDASGYTCTCVGEKK